LLTQQPLNPDVAKMVWRGVEFTDALLLQAAMTLYVASSQAWEDEGRRAKEKGAQLVSPPPQMDAELMRVTALYDKLRKASGERPVQ
jgi:hypothetical protein